MSGAELSVLVATRGRAPLLASMLDSLAGEWDAIREVIVVDNGSVDGTAELLESFASRQKKLVPLYLEQPGQSRALNYAITRSTGQQLAFIDDDVAVERGWAAAFAEAFAALDHPGFQGRIRMPPDVRADPARMLPASLYRTLPVIDYGDAFCERRTMTGANMAVRRSILDRVGPFDERLGPGAAGLSGDTELAARIRAATGRQFGYVARAAVVHVYDPTRLTDEYHELYHRRLGHSRWILKSPSPLSVYPDLAAAWTKSQLARVAGKRRSYYRQLGRYYAYREMLRLQRSERAIAER